MTSPSCILVSEKVFEISCVGNCYTLLHLKSNWIILWMSETSVSQGGNYDD